MGIEVDNEGMEKDTVYKHAKDMLENMYTYTSRWSSQRRIFLYMLLYMIKVGRLYYNDDTNSTIHNYINPQMVMF